jgi:outer membrane protein OmpA-like peptidoglycan-associated protein
MHRDWREPFFVVFVILVIVLGLLTWVRRPVVSDSSATFAAGVGPTAEVPTAQSLPTAQPSLGPELILSEVELSYGAESIELSGLVPAQAVADAMVAAAGRLVGRAAVTDDLRVAPEGEFTGTRMTMRGVVADDVERTRVVAAFTGIGVQLDVRLVLAAESRTVSDLIITSSDLSHMSDFLIATGVALELEDVAAEFTVFMIANDNLLDSVDTATLTVLSDNLDLLDDVLRFHIISGTVLSTELVPGETLTTIEGGVLAVTSGEEGQTLIGGAQLVTVDLAAINGVVHIIDALQLPPQVATEIELNRIVELDPIQFGIGSATILQASREILEQAAGILIANPVGDVEIQGHTDTDGSDEVNLELSQDRADAVLDFLVEAGVDPARLTAVGYGETNLKVNPEENAADKAANRRIEFRVG